MSPLEILMQLCRPRPLRGEQLETLAIGRDDLAEAIRPDVLIEEVLYDSSAGAPKVLLFGSRGCGKSTELARVDRDLCRRYLVVGLDVGRVRIDRARLTPEELLLLVGLAIARAAQVALERPLARHLQAIEEATTPLLRDDLGVQVAMDRLARSMVLFGTDVQADGQRRSLQTLTGSAEVVDIELGGLLRPTADRRPGEALLNAVNALIAEVREAAGRPPLVLIDELDKLPETDHALALLTGRGLLPQVGCPMVIAGPNKLLHSTRLASLREVYDEVAILYHLRCWDIHNPAEPDPDGLAKMNELIDRRLAQAVEDPADLLSPVARQILVRSSGGAVRDLVRLLSLAARKAHVKGARRIEAEHANVAVAKLRQEFEHGLSRDALTCLAEVTDAQMIPDTDLAYGLLDDRFILSYYNGRLWYFPHAVLQGLVRDRR